MPKAMGMNIGIAAVIGVSSKEKKSQALSFTGRPGFYAIGNSGGIPYYIKKKDATLLWTTPFFIIPSSAMKANF